MGNCSVCNLSSVVSVLLCRFHFEKWLVWYMDTYGAEGRKRTKAWIARGMKGRLLLSQGEWDRRFGQFVRTERAEVERVGV